MRSLSANIINQHTVLLCLRDLEEMLNIQLWRVLLHSLYSYLPQQNHGGEFVKQETKSLLRSLSSGEPDTGTGDEPQTDKLDTVSHYVVYYSHRTMSGQGRSHQFLWMQGVY